MKATLNDVSLPRNSKIKFSLEISSDYQISPSVAKKKANYFLLMNVGNLLSSGEPELVLKENIYWEIPIIYSLPSKGKIDQVGKLAVDVQNGSIELIYPKNLKELENKVDSLYQSYAL